MSSSQQQDSEAAAEFIATVRTDHAQMKEWYGRTQRNHLQQTYGPYPDLWKQVLNWNGWKEARRLFLQDQQTGNSGGGGTVDGSSGVVPKKRKSRWGDATNNNNNSSSAAAAPHHSSSNGGTSNTGNSYQDDSANKRRWAPNHNNNNQYNSYQPGGGGGGGPAASRPALPVPGLHRLPAHQQQKVQQLQSKLRQINEKLESVDADAARVENLPRGHRDRSPSPPPLYAPDGKRLNTRAVRWKDRLQSERQEIMQQLLSMSGATGMIKTKRTVKVNIPVAEFPNYNFIGLIIGPRGKTQKELEGKTGCKIAIRGKGSVKEGARKLSNDTQEPLHVVITGDDPKAVDAAEAMIKDMLVVLDDEKNVHKQQQLRELAVLNGTLKQNDEFCAHCGQKGHRAFECPRNVRRAMNSSSSNNSGTIRCAICGDTSHPTRDCTQQPQPSQAVTAVADSDYRSFMAELEGKAPPPPPVAAPATAAVPPTGGGGDLPPLPAGPGGLPLPPPPPPAALLGLPPPPPSMHGQYLPPPPMNMMYNGGGGGGNLLSPPGLPPPGGLPPPPMQQHPPLPPLPPQQQQQQPAAAGPVQVPPGQETANWDPNAYYGAAASGLNWWD